MGKLRKYFHHRIPRTKKGDYNSWLYERLRARTLDPIIPALKTEDEFISKIISHEQFWPPQKGPALIALVKSRYPSINLAGKNQMQIKMEICDIEAARNDEDVKKINSDVVNFVNRIYKILQGVKGSAEVSEDLVVTPDTLLMASLDEIGQDWQNWQNGQNWPKVKLQIAEEKRRRLGYDKLQELAIMLLRYSNVVDQDSINMHAALPKDVFDVLRSELGVSAECFASPLNATLEKYMSAFPDTDSPFGSIGSFYDWGFDEDGAFEANPPFTMDAINKMMDKFDEIMARDHLSLTFFVVVPNWSTMDRLKNAKYKTWDMVVPASQHKYIVGDQHLEASTFTAPFETYVCVFQTTLAASLRPVPKNLGAKLLAAF